MWLNAKGVGLTFNSCRGLQFCLANPTLKTCRDSASTRVLDRAFHSGMVQCVGEMCTPCYYPADDINKIKIIYSI